MNIKDFKNKSLEEITKLISNSSIEDIAKIIKELEINQPQYGLYWEKKDTEVIEKELYKDRYPYLSECKELKILNDENAKHNILIEGDNYHALKLLQYTHAGKIDVIYIDPPYNTGNKDFVYNDRYIDKDDDYRHSKWLNFMSERLKLAKTLLSENGVIFISIDNNEFAQLKLLCDSIFNESAFVTDIIVELTKTQGMKVKSAKEGSLVKNYEHILVYSNNDFNKKIVKNILYDKAEVFDNHYNIVLLEENNNLKVMNLMDYIKQNTNYMDIFKKYNIPYNINNIGRMMTVCSEFKDFILKDMKHKIFRSSMVSSDKIQSLSINSGEPIRYGKYILFKSNNSKIRQLQPLSESLNFDNEYNPEYGRVTIRGDLWKGFYSDMMNISKEGGVEFKNGKKPVRLLKQLVHMVSNKDSVILDFFAGSGSLGHAVISLNNDDCGERRFILCTNNEVSDQEVCEYLLKHKYLSKKTEFNKFKENNNIDDILTLEELSSKGICRNKTYPRLKNVLNQIPNSNLDYYKIDFFEKENLEEDDYRKFVESKGNYAAIDNIIKIKEDTYDCVFSNEAYRIYKNSNKIVGVFTKNITDKRREKMLEYLKDNKYDSYEKKIYIYGNKKSLSSTCSPFFDGISTEIIPIDLIEILKKKPE